MMQRTTVPQTTARMYCLQALRQVSRTFAINIGFLRGTLHDAVLNAYLCCRIADTVEDVTFLDRRLQIDLLQRYHAFFAGERFPPGQLATWVRDFERAEKAVSPEAPDFELLRHTPLVIEHLMSLPALHRHLIRRCVAEMAAGMASTLESRSEFSRVWVIATLSDLHRYCYYVAGTVGILLTGLFALHSRRIAAHRQHFLLRHAVAFGASLQLTNIIKDARSDYLQGRCFIPQEIAERFGLRVEHLFEPACRQRALPVMQALVRHAAGYFDRALQYILHLPRCDVRIRLFCILPLLFAVATLGKIPLRAFAEGEEMKISRAQVGAIIRASCLRCCSNRLLSAYYLRLRRAIGA